MGQKEITPLPPLGNNSARQRIYSGTVPIGAAGAVGTTDIPGAAWTVVKNAAAGRYDFTLHRGFPKIRNVLASIEGPASAGVTVGSAVPRSVNASAGTFTVQLLANVTDTDAASGNILRVTLILDEG
jgi:hypothetical protein